MFPVVLTCCCDTPPELEQLCLVPTEEEDSHYVEQLEMPAPAVVLLLLAFVKLPPLREELSPPFESLEEDTRVWLSRG